MMCDGGGGGAAYNIILSIYYYYTLKFHLKKYLHFIINPFGDADVK